MPLQRRTIPAPRAVLQWTAKVTGKTVTRRLSEDEARLYKAWIANDRRLCALVTKMRHVAAQATDLILKDAAAS